MLKNNPLSPAKNPDLRQIVYEKLKEAIVEGIIRPGSKLSEIELADKMAVSRTPVREAIRQLAQTGLVTLTPRRGAYVTLPTMKDAEDLYELRKELEKLAVSYICVDPPQKELEYYLGVFEKMDDTSSHSEYVKQDQNFHGLLYSSCNNKFLSKMLFNIMDLINLCRTYSVEGNMDLSVFLQEHRRIIEAIIAKDCARAIKEMDEHIIDTKKSFLSFLESHPEGVLYENASD